MSSQSHAHVHVHVKLTLIHVVLIICSYHVKAIDIPSTFFVDRSSLETSASPIATASVVPISSTNITLPFVNGAGDRTITAWVRFSDHINTSLSTGFFLGLGDKGTCSDKELSFGYSATENHFCVSSCNTSVAEGPVSYKGKLQRGMWYHTAFIYERTSSNLTVYVNGESGPVMQLSLDTSTLFVILGARASANLSSPWTGSIGTITSWSGVLTPSEILADLQNTLSLDAQLRAPDSGAQLLTSLGITTLTPANTTHDATYTYTVTRTSAGAPTAKIDLNTATIRIVNGTKSTGTTTTTTTPTPTVTSEPTPTNTTTTTTTTTSTTTTASTTSPPTSTPTPTVTVPPATPRRNNTTYSPPTSPTSSRQAYPPTGSVAPNFLQPQYSSIYIFLDGPTASSIINEQVEIATFAWSIRAASACGISSTRVRAVIGQTDKTYVRFDVAGAPNQDLANIMALLQIQLIGSDTVFSRDTQGGSIGSVASFRTRTAPTNIFYFPATVCADRTFRDAASCDGLAAPQPVATPTFPPITSEKWTETYRFYILIICVVLGGSVLVVLLIYCIYRYNSSDAVFSNHSTHIARQTFDATMDEVELRNFQPNPSIDNTSAQQQAVVVSVV